MPLLTAHPSNRTTPINWTVPSESGVYGLFGPGSEVLIGALESVGEKIAESRTIRRRPTLRKARHTISRLSWNGVELIGKGADIASLGGEVGVHTRFPVPTTRTLELEDARRLSKVISTFGKSAESGKGLLAHLIMNEGSYLPLSSRFPTSNLSSFVKDTSCFLKVEDIVQERGHRMFISCKDPEFSRFIDFDKILMVDSSGRAHTLVDLFAFETIRTAVLNEKVPCLVETILKEKEYSDL
jgi:hypothetical protein